MKISSITKLCLTILTFTAATILTSPQGFGQIPKGIFTEKTDKNTISVEGRFGFGSCYEVHARGDTLLAGNGPLLEIFDFAIPETPIRLGSLLLSGSITSINSAGSLAFVYSIGLGLAIIDISTLSAPQIISVFASEGQVWHQAEQGDLLFLANSVSGLRIINVADPKNPVEIGTYHATDVKAVAVDGNLAFLSSFNGGLRILDISKPTQPREIGQDTSLVGKSGIAVRGNHVFAADLSGLRVYDVSNPAQPIQVAELLQWYDCPDLAIRGNTVFLTCQVNAALVAIDITDPKFPSYLGSLDGYISNAVTSGSRWLYASASKDGFLAIDVTNPVNPVIVESFNEHGSSTVLGVHDAHAYVATLFDEVRILDISETSRPRQVGTYPTPSGVLGIALQDQVAYLAARNEGLVILDVSNPAAPTTLGSLRFSFAFDVAVRGDLVFGVGTEGLYIIDVSNPSSPQLLGHYFAYPHCRKLDITGDFVFLTQLVGDVFVIDVQDPTLPGLVTMIDGSGRYFLDVAISGNQAYFPNSENGVEVFDISDPSAPIFRGAVTIDGSARDIAINFPYAYVADGNGLTALDIGDPANILTIGSMDINSGLKDVSFVDGLIWATSQETGMWILRHNSPTAVPSVRGSGTATLFAAYPNPFNPQTIIRFHLSGRQGVSLDVFSVNGRHIASLVEDVLDPGPHQVVWTGRDDAGRSVASGTYFYRLDAGGYVQTKSMVMIK